MNGNSCMGLCYMEMSPLWHHCNGHHLDMGVFVVPLTDHMSLGMRTRATTSPIRHREIASNLAKAHMLVLD